MSLEIGPNRPHPPSIPRAARPSTSAVAATLRSAAPVDTAEVGIPAAVREAVGVAADRADALAAQQRELHFERDERTGRVAVQVRDLRSGEVLRTIPPSQALDVLSGAPLEA